MKLIKTTLVLCAFLSTIHAFQDQDLDGIEDKYDICPNTPFDAKVDRFGCAVIPKQIQQARANQHLTLSIGTTLLRDTRYDDDSSLNFYANYQFSHWNVSVSNTRSMTNTDYNEDYINSDNDIYLSIGYTIYMPNTLFKFSLGSKITSDSENNDKQKKYPAFSNDYETQNLNEERDNDYFGAINLDHFITKRQDVFLYYSYTNSGDSSVYDYEDYSSFSVGSGYQVTPSFYSALSYNYTGSIYQDGDPQENITWFNNYSFNKNFFITGSYSYALDDYSYENTYTISLGARF